MPDNVQTSAVSPGAKRISPDLFKEISDYLVEFPGLLADGINNDPPPPELSNYVAQAAPSFSEHLQKLIRESGEKDSEVYGRAGIDRRHFSKIRSDAAYAPKKTTVIAFAIALHLSYRDADILLRLAGFTLSRSSKFDLIIRFFIERGIYDFGKINDALYDFGQPVINV